MELNTRQLVEIIRKDCELKSFLGVYARDQLPLVFSYPACLIVNTDNADQSGEHWLAIYYNEKKEADFFDSYGSHPISFGLDTYMNRTSSSWNWNSHQLQSMESRICGYYCVLFLMYRARGLSLAHFIKRFKDNSNINDLVLLNLLKP